MIEIDGNLTLPLVISQLDEAVRAQMKQSEEPR